MHNRGQEEAGRNEAWLSESCPVLCHRLVPTKTSVQTRRASSEPDIQVFFGGGTNKAMREATLNDIPVASRGRVTTERPLPALNVRDPRQEPGRQN